MPFRARLSLAAFLLVASTDIPTLAAQGGPLQPPSTGGVPALLQELRMLGHHKRVLMIGAHPDDEDTELLVLLTRHEGAEAAYLSLTRGEGGQNLIGTELGPALGILRTEELLAARRVDGAGQFFSRAYDFGFSKTIDDAWAHWPRDSVLKDVVRIVRRFRPQVIVSVFSGTPRDGHGQHQAAGWAAAQAFRVAGDPGAFPELATEEGLAPWTPEKLYRSARFDAGAATVTVDGGALEPLSGKTYHQLAMAARSLHRSQDMGVLQDLGPSPTRLALVARRDGRAADPGAGWEAFWSGVDTAWGLPAAHLQALADARAAALGGGELSRARARAVAPVAPVADASDIAWSDYLEHLARARALADGVLLDVIAGDDRVVPGDTVALEVLARNTGGATTDPLKAVLSPRGGALFRTELDGALAPGELRRSRFGFRLPAEWAPTTPYYLRAPRDGDLYRWEGDPALRGAAAGPDELALSLEAPGADPHRDGLAWHLARGASSRVRDQANGEIRRPLTVVPRVSVTLAPEVAVVRADARGEARVARFEVTLTHAGEGVARGTVRLTLPWRGVRAPSAPFTRDSSAT